MASAPTRADLKGWTPVRVSQRETGPMVEWCHTAGIEFDDPFFDQTLERCMRNPFRLLFRQETTLEEVLLRLADHPGIAPSGFVFHGSRCGSTLITQMLTRVPSTLCLSEAGPIDTILRADRIRPGVARADQIDWLRAVVAALAQPRRPGQRHLVVKLDAWSILQLGLVRAAFPAVPWIFVYREPVEVLVSQLHHRGYHMIPGSLAPADVGLAPGDAERLRPEEYVAHILSRLYRAGMDGHVPGRSLLVDYRDLPDAVPDAIAPLFGIEIDGPARGAMLAAAGRDAKNPVVPFEADGAAKRGAASAAVYEAAGGEVADAYNRLRSAHGAQVGQVAR